MAKCNHCGKSGIFFKVNASGVCAECERILPLEAKEQQLRSKIAAMQDTLAKSENEYAEIKAKKDELYREISEQAKKDALAQITEQINTESQRLQGILAQIETNKAALDGISEEFAQSKKTIASNANKLRTLQTLFKSMQYSSKRYFDEEGVSQEILSDNLPDQADELLSTTVELKLHLMDIRELKKLYNQNNRIIRDLLARYQTRYTTKANMTIYRLMVIALEAELQNVLYNLSYSKLDKAIKDVKTITAKYLKIATDGNQNIAATVTKFIGEIEYLFIEAIKIEYEYYIQKERIKEEQKAIREQIRQEAAERKLLEEQRKKVEQEEAKFLGEINNIRVQLSSTQDETKIRQLEERIAKLQVQLENVEKKKEDIITLQNGKAGYIYIISNLGSFGDNVFKVGMTRRLSPQDRIDELGDASVPFKFDVHSLIFSESAPDLEYKLHKHMNNQRVNKVNLRKEFFNTSIDALEELVYSLEPSAEFNRTMLAAQYYQSMAIKEVPDEVLIIDDEGVGEDEE
jgi:hypothetical protein